MRASAAELCDRLDAEIFTGDGFHDLKAIEELRELLRRWSKELASIQNEILPEQEAERGSAGA